MNVALRTAMTREQFFRWAERQEGRYEFDGVRPVAVIGGTNNHGLIASNLNGQLYLRLRGTRCRSMGSEGGGVAVPGNGVRYPDATVTCSPIPGRERLCPDPVVVFEVLSPSTERTDLTEKLRDYHAVMSIKRYVVVEQSRREAVAHWRQGIEPWVRVERGADDVLELPEIGIAIPLAELYEGVSFDGGQA